MNPTVEETARLLGGTPGWVRSLLQRGKCGDCWSNGKNRKTYVVIPSKLAAFMEISEDDLLNRLARMRQKESERYDGLHCKDR